MHHISRISVSSPHASLSNSYADLLAADHPKKDEPPSHNHLALMGRIHALRSAEGTAEALRHDLASATEEVAQLRRALEDLKITNQHKMEQAMEKGRRMEVLLKELVSEREAWKATEHHCTRCSSAQLGTQPPDKPPTSDAVAQTDDSHAEVATIVEGIATLAVVAACRPERPFIGSIASNGGGLALRYTNKDGWVSWYSGSSIASLDPAERVPQLVFQFAMDVYTRRMIGDPPLSELLGAVLTSLGAGSISPNLPWPTTSEDRNLLVSALTPSDQYLTPRIVIARSADGSEALITAFAPMGADYVFHLTAADANEPISSWLPMSVLDGQFVSFRVVGKEKSNANANIISIATSISAKGRGGPSHAALGTDLWLHYRDSSELPTQRLITNLLSATVTIPSCPSAGPFALSLIRRGNYRLTLRSAELLHWYSTLAQRPETLEAIVRLVASSQHEEASNGLPVCTAIGFVSPSENEAPAAEPVFWPLRLQVNSVDRFSSMVTLLEDSQADEGPIDQAHCEAAIESRRHNYQVSRHLAAHADLFLEWLDCCSDMLVRYQCDTFVMYSTSAAIAASSALVHVWGLITDEAAITMAEKTLAFTDECAWRAESNLYVTNELVACSSEWAYRTQDNTRRLLDGKLDLIADSIAPSIAISYGQADMADEAIGQAGAFASSALRWCWAMMQEGQRYLTCHLQLLQPLADESAHASRMLAAMEVESGGLVARYSELLREHRLALSRLEATAAEADSLRVDLRRAAAALIESQSVNQNMRRRFAMEMARSGRTQTQAV